MLAVGGVDDHPLALPEARRGHRTLPPAQARLAAVRLRSHRLDAYRWFERGVLVQIFVTQVFEFAQEQLAGVGGLVFNILLWVAVRAMIRAEVERELVRREPVPS